MAKLNFVCGLLAALLYCSAAQDDVPQIVDPIEINGTALMQMQQPRGQIDVDGLLYFFRCNDDQVEVYKGDTVALLTPVLTKKQTTCSLKVKANENMKLTFQCMEKMVLHPADRFIINGKEYKKKQVEKPIGVQGKEIDVVFKAPKSWKKNRSLACLITTPEDTYTTSTTTTVTPPPSDECQCGKRNVGGLVDSRIVGGEDADAHEFPWQVAVYYKKNGGGTSFCGGSIVSKNYVITAAHCVGSNGEVSVGVGIHDRGQTQKIVKAKFVKMHEQYDPSTIDYDIAVITVEEPFDFSDPKVGPVCLPSKDAEHDGKPVTISGWGLRNDGSGLPTILQTVDVKVITEAKCKEFGGSFIKERMICTLGDGTESTCSGDSGGPLVYKTSSDSYELVGVVSWVFVSGGQCDPEKPNGFARVTSVELYPWIQTHTKGLAGTCQ